MYSKYSTASVQATVEFQAASTDPKVKISPDTFSEIGTSSSVTQVNVVATTSSTVATEL